MPPAPKSSTLLKKSGSPKAKGAARAKSGCYTCRIRRKKCDEQKSDRGGCKTCDRLRLECLGYGVKRPDWLRESQMVTEIREKIKKFLASQGMIKGHSGPLSRDADQDHFLTLKPDYNNSPDTESSTMSGGIRSPSPTLYRASSPAEESWDPYTPFSSLTSSQCHDGPFMPISTQLIESSCEDPYSGDEISQGWRLPYWMPATFYPFYDPVTQYYGTYVFDVQYFLANTPQIRQMVMDSLQSHSVCRNVVRILSELHSGRKRLPQRAEGIPIILRYLKNTGTGSLDDAMAVLHAVSVYLFNGGDGSWEECIDFAAKHVDIVLGVKFFCHSNPLQLCDEKTAFIVKTAIWFDVLASITTQKPPRLRAVIDRLFNPFQSHIEDIGDPFSNQCSMLSPMGCENDVVWAISEISALAEWKREEESKGRLSVPELANKGKTLEQVLDNPRCLQPCRDDPSVIMHYSTANIFRAAAQLYLASVVSGDRPLVREIAWGTQKTYSAITAIHRSSLQPVVRSTVFAFFLCGCFSVDKGQQEYIKDVLLCQEQSTELGNCKSIVNLLEDIWKKTSAGDPRPVPWQALLREKHILLV